MVGISFLVPVWEIVLGVSRGPCILHFSYTGLLAVSRIDVHVHVSYITWNVPLLDSNFYLSP